MDLDDKDDNMLLGCVYVALVACSRGTVGIDAKRSLPLAGTDSRNA